jgi:hypothetical protein
MAFFFLFFLAFSNHIYAQPNSNCAPTDRVCSFSVDNAAQDHITVLWYYINALSSTTFRTVNSSSSAGSYTSPDTVMSIVDQNGNIMCTNNDDTSLLGSLNGVTPNLRTGNADF